MSLICLSYVSHNTLMCTLFVSGMSLIRLFLSIMYLIRLKRGPFVSPSSLVSLGLGGGRWVGGPSVPPP